MHDHEDETGDDGFTKECGARGPGRQRGGRDRWRYNQCGPGVQAGRD
jgi:hypothetical protein